jgi:hypothetical protein
LKTRMYTSEKNQGNVPNNNTNKYSKNMNVYFASIGDIGDIITFLSKSKTFVSGGRRYFQSWKWYKLNLERSEISKLIAGKMIIVARIQGTYQVGGLAILSKRVSENFSPRQLQGRGQNQKQFDFEEDNSNYIDDYDGYDDDAAFQLGYLDAPSSAILDSLVVFVANLVISSSKFERIQLFTPGQIHDEISNSYELEDRLAKFGIRKSECFLLYVRSL